MIQILIADDHAIVREGLKQLFALDNEISVVAEAENGDQVLTILREKKIDLVLLDMTMPGISGFKLVSQINMSENYLPILVLSMHNELSLARRALAAGAAGYLTKDSDPKTLMAAIRKVASGGRFIDPRLAEKIVFDSIRPVQRSPHELLSAREFQILLLLVAGKSVNGIAEELSISNKTVSTHKTRLMQKMNFQNNAELVMYGVEHGFSMN